MNRVKLLIPEARTVLKHKKFCKARQLARKLEVSNTLAGQILKEMAEWSKWTTGTAKVTWAKGVEE